MGKVYIHYGHSAFSSEKFIDVKDNPEDLCEGHKPHSGLWGSDIESVHGWRELLRSDKDIAKYQSWRLSQSFLFSLKETANILTLNNEIDFHELLKPYLTDCEFDIRSLPVFKYKVNWKKLAKDYDGIEAYTGTNIVLKEILAGWDCDSICVFHKEQINLIS